MTKTCFLIILVSLSMFSHSLIGQIEEKVYLFDKNRKVCFNIDSAYYKTQIIKVLNNHFVVVYSYCLHNEWSKGWNCDNHFDELIMKKDTAFNMLRIYRVCFGEEYTDYDNELLVVINKKEDLYAIVKFSKSGKKLCEGKSRYIFPFVWHDTLSFFSPEGLITKQMIYDSGEEKETLYLNDKGEILDKVYGLDSLDIEPVFFNSNDRLEVDLRKFLSNCSYPQEALDKLIMGYVPVFFIITRDGEISHVEDIMGIPVLGEYCINKVKSLPKIIPGKVDNAPVNTRIIYPFRFSID